MPTIGAPLRNWTPLWLLLCSIPTCAYAQSTNETAQLQSSISAAASSLSTKEPVVTLSPPKSSTTSFSDTACPFRTINYITHTLPQQCLKTSWSASGQVPSGEVADTEEAAPTPQVVIPWAREGSGTQEGATSTTGLQSEETGSATASGSGAQAEGELEADSPLDNANFLSFEEWKKKNLARAGQSPENVGQGRAASSESRAQRRPVNINALDSLGDESEIEIDFGGFGNPAQGEPGSSNLPTGTQDAVEATRAVDEEDKIAPSSWALSKDAGKTCKERFNYASFDCAATVLKTNNKAKSSSAVLVENKDSYMLNECSAENKFVIVELCDDILVDTVVLANYEFFSSMFRHFRVSVSDRYPVKMDRWRTLATFEARNSRDIQPFLVTEPQIWARYLRIEFLTHYGNEFYCPISLLRVHGTTMMEQFRREEEEARGVDDFAEPIESADGEPVKTADDSGPVPTEQLPFELEKSGSIHSEVPVSDNTSDSQSVNSLSGSIKTVPQSTDPGNLPVGPVQSIATSDSTSTSEEANSSTEKSNASSPSGSSSASASAKSSQEEPSTHTQDSKRTEAPVTASHEHGSSSQRSVTEEKVASSSTTSAQNGKGVRSSANETASVPSGTSSVKTPSNSTNSASQAQSQSRGSSQTQPNPASPTTQESFFKSIHKRLQQLEANSTLSLQYIEEQSRILRDAFMKVERRQLSKTEKFLNHLNSTVMQELKSYRSMYDQLWQSTILELEGMKERQKAEMSEIGTRLSLVADELVWQKRMAVVQSTLLLLCLGLVLFVRSGTLGSQPDMPIVQQLGNKYSNFFDSPPRSPEKAGVLRRRRTFRNMWRSDTSAGLSDGFNAVSDAETDGRRSPVQVEFSPPTPETAITASGMETSPEGFNDTKASQIEEQDTGLLTPIDKYPNFDDQAKRIQVLETQSGPATPHGSRDSRPSWEEVDRAVNKLKAEEQGDGMQSDRNGDRERRKKRSPLRGAESYDGAVDDSPDDDSGEGLFAMG